MIRSIPIRVKFGASFALVMALALTALAGGTLFNLYRKQIVEADHDIDSETKELQVLLPSHRAEDIVWELDPHMGWTVFDENGRLLKSDPIITEEASRPALTQSGIISTGTFRHGWRVEAFPAGTNRTIVVGYDMIKVHGVLRDLVMAYAWSLPLVVVVVAVGSWWATGRALSPFRKLADVIEGLQSENLAHRVPEPLAQDEIRRLSANFNGLLFRLEKSFAQTKRFAADASHELRTPLTIMRSEVERILTQPDLPQGPQAALVSLQDEIARLDRITEQLLQLARFDAGQITLNREAVDYSRLLNDACEDAGLLALAAKVDLTFAVKPEIRINGDPTHLRRLFLNLLDNACKHNRPGGLVHCSLDRDGNHATLRISNTGPGIPPEMRQRVFERFFRADPSRANTRGHGLGLALSWEIVDLHGGELTLLETQKADWTEFEVKLAVCA